MRIVVEKI